MSHATIARTACRNCGAGLYPLLDLGRLVPSDFLRPEDPDPPALPLAVMTCDGCGLVQLQHTVDPESLFRQYWYQSGINETMRAELADVVARIDRAEAPVDHVGATVLDIGANDGTLLSFYDAATTCRVAFEPAYNLHDRLRAHADVIYPEFFPGEASRRLAAHSIDVITAIAMFYDLDDPHACVHEVDRLLTEDGLWIVQLQDLAQQVETRAVDNVVFEHLCYYSLDSFSRLLDDVNLHVVAVERRDINGGSLRLTIQRHHVPIEPSIQAWAAKEQPLITRDALERFAWRVGEQRLLLQAAVAQAVRQHGYLDLYAASTKASTLLQYAGIDRTLVRQAAERTSEKWGRVTSGTRIPIVSEAVWRQDPAPVTLIGAYQFADTFCWREAQYLADGGSFLVPLPSPRIVSHAHV